MKKKKPFDLKVQNKVYLHLVLFVESRKKVHESFVLTCPSVYSLHGNQLLVLAIRDLVASLVAL